MLRKVLVFMFLVSASSVFAENVLILHGQSIPPESLTNFKSETMNTVIEAVFSQAFDKSHIAFDANLEDPDNLPAAGEITLNAKKYGGDKVIVFLLVWKKGSGGSTTFDHLDYLMSRQNGQVLCKGRIDISFNALSADEPKKASELAFNLTEKLKTFY